MMDAVVPSHVDVPVIPPVTGDPGPLLDSGEFFHFLIQNFSTISFFKIYHFFQNIYVDEVHKQIDQMLHDDIIREAEGSVAWNSPVHVVVDMRGHVVLLSLSLYIRV